ncbi:perilipin-2 isoform X2 [Engraulis encrasicolus]|uniref:perilipin-2 isoform X2 n=1 Tax=Engraulis encrasicolus TaxID=184585 RepID=UPI002FD259B4
MASMETISDQNVMSRVASLPLVSSTYSIVSTVYGETKEQHPYLKAVCEAAEVGVKTVSILGMTCAQPIIGKLEPQLMFANGLACKGLDQIERKLPILHQPSEKIMASAKDAVSGAKDTVAMTVSGAKGTVAMTVYGAKDTVVMTVFGAKDTVTMTVSGAKDTVSSAVSGVVGRTCGAVQGGVASVISTSESLIEHYLPQAKGSQPAEGCEGDGEGSSYYVRLGSLSAKLRHRSYERAVTKIEHAKRNIGSANQKMQEKLRTLVDWRSTTDTADADETSDAEHIESRTLALARGLSHQLQTTCYSLVCSAQGLPQNIQDQLLTVTQSAVQVYLNFSHAVSLGDLSDSVLTTSRNQLHRVKDTLEGAMDYLVNNTPLNWLVGPFYPHIEPEAPPAGSRKKSLSFSDGALLIADARRRSRTSSAGRLSICVGSPQYHSHADGTRCWEESCPDKAAAVMASYPEAQPASAPGDSETDADTVADSLRPRRSSSVSSPTSGGKARKSVDFTL